MLELNICDGSYSEDDNNLDSMNMLLIGTITKFISYLGNVDGILFEKKEYIFVLDLDNIDAGDAYEQYREISAILYCNRCIQTIFNLMGGFSEFLKHRYLLECMLMDEF